MDMGKLGNKRERGRKAKLLMENEVLNAVFDGIEKELIESWRNSRADEFDLREDARCCIKMLDRLRNGIKAVAIDGELAARELLQNR